MIISWNSTNQCNMYCDHCYRDSGAKASDELNTEEAKDLLDEIAKAGFKIMIFSGGEPLMRRDIVELATYASAIGLRPVMGSNGTLLTLPLAKDLKAAGVMGIGISLDSLDVARHDQLRQYPGAWEEAVRGMDICRQAGLAFQVHTTVMDWNQQELEALTNFAVKQGAVAHHFFFLVPTGRGENIEKTSLQAEEYESVITRIMEKQKSVPIELKPTCAPQFMRIASEMGLKMRYGRGCLAGTSYCIISPRGLVQPCAYMDMVVGDVRKTPFSKIWEESPVFQELRTMEYKGYCGHCRYKVTCGGCRARAGYYHGGDYMAEEPWCLYRGGEEEDSL